jgi:hypothetical protein
MNTYIFKISLLENSGIFREIEVPSNWNLYKLAESIILSFNFDFDHCFGFFSNISERDCFCSKESYELFTDLENVEPVDSKSVKKTKVKDVWENTGDKMLFLFDYGDSWMWVVELIKVGEEDKKIKYPRIIKKVGRAPKQY